MWPPSSEDSLLACMTIAIAFQRIAERIRCSSSRSPENGVWSCGGIVLTYGRRALVGRWRADAARAVDDALDELLRALDAVVGDDRVEGLEPLAGLLRVYVCGVHRLLPGAAIAAQSSRGPRDAGSPAVRMARHGQRLRAEFGTPSATRRPTSGSASRIGRQTGARQLGASLFELPPGAASFPLHIHYANEEMLVVLAGRPTLETLIGIARVLEPGEVVVCPAGRDGAHRLTNAPTSRCAC